MDCSSCCETGCCETFDSGMIESFPGSNCANGSCPMEPGFDMQPGFEVQPGEEWGGAAETFVPYSHEGEMYAPEAYPMEPTPHPMNGNERESLIVPPTQSDPPEGDFKQPERDGQVIRGPQAAAQGPVHQTRWIPHQF